MRSDTERLQDILEAIERLEKYAVKGKRAFKEQELIQTWIIHHLQIVGEATRSISQDLKQQYPNIAWRDAADLRNLVVHEYFRINIDIIWDIVENDLPMFKQQIKTLFKQQLGNY